MTNKISETIKDAFSQDDFDPDNFESKQPKAVLIEFLQQTNKEDLLYTFTIKGTKTVATNFIHCMRVELSRLRRKAIAQGRTPTQFKILRKSIIHDNKTRTCEIILQRQIEKEISPELDSLLDTFCMEEDI